MKARFRNSNFDVEIEGDTKEDILEEFQREYPERFPETVIIEWEK